MHIGMGTILKRILVTSLTIVALAAMGLLILSIAQVGLSPRVLAATRSDAIPEAARQAGDLSLGVTANSPAITSRPTSSQAVAGGLPPASVWTPPTPAYKISIAADGVYQLTYTDLQTAGLPVDTLDPRTFRVFYMGQEAAIRVIGESDGRFDAGDAVVFYGRGVDDMYFDGLTPINKYTGTNIYWLTYGGLTGLRMAIKDGSGTGSTPEPFRHLAYLEFNIAQVGATYWSSLPYVPDTEHWYRDWYLTGPGGTPTRAPYYFAANNVASGPYTATFTANVLGYNEVAHRVKFFLNGNLMLDDSTSGVGRTLFQTSTQVPQSYLIEGSNAITVELASPDDQIYLDWMKLTYYDQHVAEGDQLAFSSEVSGTWRYSVTQFSTADIEVYDVSNLVAPQIITNTTVTGTGPYAVEFGDTTTNSSASYVALTPTTRQTPAKIEAVVPMTSQYTPVDLLSIAEGADYIIITHRNFLSDALRLANHRSSQYRVKLIDVQSIYDQFNGGLMSAESIHDFLAYAYANWVRPAPSYVVLMGDGSYDMRLYKGLSSNVTYIPPYLALVDPSLGETAAENRFVTLVGNDLMPDMHIGRLPVNTVAEAKAMVDKIMAYENDCKCQPGGWNKNLLFLADDAGRRRRRFLRLLRQATVHRLPDEPGSQPANSARLHLLPLLPGTDLRCGRQSIASHRMSNRRQERPKWHRCAVCQLCRTLHQVRMGC